MKIDKEQTIFYLKLLLCTSLIGVWIMCLTSFPEAPKKVKKSLPVVKKEIEVKKIIEEKKEVYPKKEVVVMPTPQAVKPVPVVNNLPKPTPQKTKTQEKKEIKKEVKIAEVKKEIKPKEKSVPVDKQKQPPTKTIAEKNIPKSETSKQIHLANKIEVKKMLNDVKSLTNIISPPKEAAKPVASATPQAVAEQKEPVVEVKPVPSPNINLALLNLPNVAGATRKALEGMSQDAEVEKPAEEVRTENESLRKEVPLKKGTLRPVSDQINAATNKDRQWVPRYLQEENKELENKVDTLSKNLEQLANQIEVRGFVNGREGQKSVIIRNTLNDKVEILNKGDSYHGVFRLKEINEKDIVLENESLNKTFVKKAPN